MRINSLISASTISTFLLTLLTPLIAKGQFADNPETNAVTSVAMQSCAGIGKPLSKAEIRNRSSSSELITTVFEKFALRSIGVPPNKNPTRRFPVYELGLSVEPDGIEPLKLLAIKRDGTVVRNQDFEDSIFSFIPFTVMLITPKVAFTQQQSSSYQFPVIPYSSTNMPVCYMQTQDGSIQNLSSICGKKPEPPIKIPESPVLPELSSLKKLICEGKSSCPANLAVDVVIIK